MIRYRQNFAAVAYVAPPVQSESAAPQRVRYGGRQEQDGSYAAPILLEVERWMRQHRMSASRFGRLAVGDSHLISDLRRGRDPSSRTAARIRAFMQASQSGGGQSVAMFSSDCPACLPTPVSAENRSSSHG